MSAVIQTFGRKLRLALIGGGPDSFIGPIHRSCAILHERFEIVAAVLSSSPEKSQKLAAETGIPRAYGSAAELITAESQRKDGADVLAILTPNDSHFDIAKQAAEAGLHIVCEKPLTNDLDSAIELEQIVAKNNVLFAVAYCYSAYPMVRQARAMVEEGVLGEIRMMSSQYIQGHLAALTDEERSGNNWRLQSDKGGASMILGDIATHSYHLLEFVTGLKADSLCADVLATVPGREGDDYSGMMIRYGNGARAMMQITQAAAGGNHGLNFVIYGEKGGLEWYQEQPNELVWRPIDAPVQILERGGKGIHPAASAVTHVAGGHPEGYRDAFANIYYELAEHLVAKEQGNDLPDYLWYPRLDEGVEGMRFVDAAVKSRDKGGDWVSLSR